MASFLHQCCWLLFFIYSIPIIFRFLVLTVISSHTVTVSLFSSQHNVVVSLSRLLILFFGCFLIAHECDHSFGSLLTYELLCWAMILLPYNPPWKPDYGIVLCSCNNAVDGDQSCSDIAPLSPLIANGVPPVKNSTGSLYDGAALIAPEGGNTYGIWRPPRFVHQWSGCFPHHNRLETEAYP